jgi:hypothetical protein
LDVKNCTEYVFVEIINKIVWTKVVIMFRRKFSESGEFDIDMHYRKFVIANIANKEIKLSSYQFLIKYRLDSFE